MVQNKADIKVVPLVCKTCGSILKANEGEVLFFCPNCETGWEIVVNSLVKRQVFYAAPHKSYPQALKILYLPFWVYEISELEIMDEDKKRKDYFYQKLENINKIYVEAYDSFMSNYYGNLAQQYITASDQYNRTRPERIVGCTRSSVTLEPFLKYYLLRFMDRLRDVTDVDIAFKSTEPVLIGFPYAWISQHEIKDLTLGMSILTQGIMNFHVFVREFYPQQMGTG